MTDRVKPNKPLGTKAYGSIPHLPGSRRGPGDHGLDPWQASILTVKTRDKHDVVVVQEKLDGSCVAAAKINGQIVALIRAGYLAADSNYRQHHVFAAWVERYRATFDAVLKEGQRICGEWLMKAHGTKYELSHDPFVAFDIIDAQNKRLPYEAMWWQIGCRFVTPYTVANGAKAVSIEFAMADIGINSHHGAVDEAEGAVWRVERKGIVDFLGKYVRPNKVDGKYLETISGQPPVYNWEPTL